MAFKTPNLTASFIRGLLGDDFLARGVCGGDAAKDGLLQLAQYADKHMIPVLLPESAAFLKQLVMLVRPKKVLEIGTGIGYSGHIILQNSEAHLHTTEHNENSLAIAREFFAASGLLERVTFLRGDESEIIPYIVGEFDMIFLDGAKTRYPQHLPFLKNLLPMGGVLLADNILFNGLVSGEKQAGKKQSIASSLKSFLQTLCADKDFSTSILSQGDGLSLSIKIV